MNKREKIIIIVVLLVGAYAAMDYFVFSDDKTDGRDTVQAEKKINDFSALAATQLTAAGKRYSQRLEHLITRGEADWSRDPFHQYIPSNQEEVALDGKTLVINYSGYIQAGKRILAVINGMEYKTGDMLLEVGYRISSITPLRVVLETAVNKEIIIFLEEN